MKERFGIKAPGAILTKLAARVDPYRMASKLLLRLAERDLIGDNDPDIILLSEPTQWWLEHLDGLEDDYPYTPFRPQENHDAPPPLFFP